MNEKKIKEEFSVSLRKWKNSMSRLQEEGAGAYLRVINILTLSQLLHAYESGAKSPYASLSEAMNVQTAMIELFLKFQVFGNNWQHKPEHSNALTVRKLYESAWTSFSEKTYERSLELIHKRLAVNGMQQAFFKDKICLDGGCGTGRFTIAMAQMGAKKSVGIDIGVKSLAFAEQKKKLYKLRNATFREMRTDSLDFPDEYFDVVISNGVLHHTEDPEKGLSEHLRVLKRGGTLWLYLYGKGGIFWMLYDVFKLLMKNIPYDYACEILKNLHLDDNKFYLFSDNVYVPIRKYYSYKQVHTMLGKYCSYKYELLRGATGDDDVKKLLNQPYGKDFWGPEGEIRMKIIKYA